MIPADIVDLAVLVIALGATVIAYLAPTVTAYRRGHHQRASIAVINIGLGWTLVGWVVAMAMAVSATRETAG